MKINRINYNNLFWIIFFVMIALPLHASNKLISYLSITGMVSIFHVLLGGMLIYAFAVAIKSHKISIGKSSILIYLLGLALIGTFVNGIKNHPANINNVIGDFTMYFLSYSILCITNSRIFKNVDLRWFLKATFYAMTICLTINVLMYVTSGFSFWGYQNLMVEDLVGGMFLLSLSLFYMGYMTFCMKKQ